MKIYIDTTTEPECVGLLFHEDVQTVFCGTLAHTEPQAYRHIPKAEEFRQKGLHFWFGTAPQPPIYTIPQTTLFAHDGEGGYFLKTEEFIYHWDGTRCFRVCDDLRSFPPDWRLTREPAQDITVYPSRKAAEADHHIYSLQELMEEFK